MDLFISISEMEIDATLIGVSGPTQISLKKKIEFKDQSDWKHGPISIDQSEFKGVPGLKIEVSSTREFNFFSLLVTPKFILFFVQETNRYAGKRLEGSELIKYQKVTEKEMYKLFIKLGN